MKGETLLGVMIIFFIVFAVVSAVFYFVLGNLPGKEIVAIFTGLFAGFIVSGRGFFVWSRGN